MNLIKTFFLAFTVSSFSIASSQNTNHEVSIVMQYKEMEKLERQLENLNPEEVDYDQLVTYAYPGFVKMVGGKEAYKKMLRSAMSYDDEEEDWEDDYEEDDEYVVQSTSFKYKVGPVYQSGGELQAVVEVQEIEEFFNRYDIYKTYDLVISQDGGKSWYIIDAEMNPRNFVPNLNENIILPEETEETTFKDENN